MHHAQHLLASSTCCFSGRTAGIAVRVEGQRNRGEFGVRAVVIAFDQHARYGQFGFGCFGQ